MCPIISWLATHFLESPLDAKQCYQRPDANELFCKNVKNDFFNKQQASMRPFTATLLPLLQHYFCYLSRLAKVKKGLKCKANQTYCIFIQTSSTEAELSLNAGGKTQDYITMERRN